jgi:hypothetical protein
MIILKLQNTNLSVQYFNTIILKYLNIESEDIKI